MPRTVIDSDSGSGLQDRIWWYTYDANGVYAETMAYKNRQNSVESASQKATYFIRCQGGVRCCLQKMHSIFIDSHVKSPRENAVLLLNM